MTVDTVDDQRGWLRIEPLGSGEDLSLLDRELRLVDDAAVSELTELAEQLDLLLHLITSGRGRGCGRSRGCLDNVVHLNGLLCQ